MRTSKTVNSSVVPPKKTKCDKQILMSNAPCRAVLGIYFCYAVKTSGTNLIVLFIDTVNTMRSL